MSLIDESVGHQENTMIDISLSSFFQRSPEFTASLIDDDLVCMDSQTGNYFALNETGELIWSLLEAPLRLDSLIEEMSNVFSDFSADKNDEIVHFLMRLVSLGAISIVSVDIES